MKSILGMLAFFLWLITGSFLRYAYIAFPLIVLIHNTILLFVIVFILLLLCSFIPFLEQIVNLILMPWGLFSIIAASPFDIFDYIYFVFFVFWLISLIKFLVILFIGKQKLY